MLSNTSHVIPTRIHEAAEMQWIWYSKFAFLAKERLRHPNEAAKIPIVKVEPIQKESKYTDASLEFSIFTAGITPKTPPGLGGGKSKINFKE